MQDINPYESPRGIEPRPGLSSWYKVFVGSCGIVLATYLASCHIILFAVLKDVPWTTKWLLVPFMIWCFVRCLEIAAMVARDLRTQGEADYAEAGIRPPTGSEASYWKTEANQSTIGEVPVGRG